MLYPVGQTPSTPIHEEPVQAAEQGHAAQEVEQAAQEAPPQAIRPPFWHVMVVKDGKAVCIGMTQEELDSMRSNVNNLP